MNKIHNLKNQIFFSIYGIFFRVASRILWPAHHFKLRMMLCLNILKLKCVWRNNIKRESKIKWQKDPNRNNLDGILREFSASSSSSCFSHSIRQIYSRPPEKSKTPRERTKKKKESAFSPSPHQNVTLPTGYCGDFVLLVGGRRRTPRRRRKCR